MNTLGYVFMIIGGMFMTLGGLGVLRMPDTLNRIQAGTKATTLGLFSIMIGICFVNPVWTLKALVVIIFVAISNPVGSSVLGRAVYHSNKENLILNKNDYEGGEESV
jgi:multicomponent Na+:H+ antiporter subunit G